MPYMHAFRKRARNDAAVSMICAVTKDMDDYGLSQNTGYESAIFMSGNDI